MPRAIQTIAGYYTAGAGGTGVATPAPGSSFTVPSFTIGSGARVGNVYTSGADVDFVRIRSPRMHDPNQGMRLRTVANSYQPLLPWECSEVLYPSDTPTVEIDVTAASTGGILVHYDYDDLPGVQPRFAALADIQSRVVHIMGDEVDVTSGAIGTWGASAAINSLFDNFNAGADYALLGYELTTACLGINISGQDTGNLPVGGPGDTNSFRTRDYFVTMSERTGRPCIPIIAANNKGSTYVQNVDVAATTATKVTLILAELS